MEKLIFFIQVRMRANPPPQSGVQCLGQARTLRFICFYSVIEPAERESRRAPRGKPARPGFWTHGKTTPRCSILGGPIGIQICIQILLVFWSLSPWLAAVSLHFWFHFWSILEAFGLHFASFWSLLASFGRPWRGSWEEGCFFIDFWG